MSGSLAGGGGKGTTPPSATAIRLFGEVEGTARKRRAMRGAELSFVKRIAVCVAREHGL